MKSVDQNLLRRIETKIVSITEANESISAVPMSIWSAPEDFPDHQLQLIMPKEYRNNSHYLLCCWLIALAKNTPWKEELRLTAIQKCKENKYLGDWMLLHHAIKLNSLDLCIYVLLESYLSADDIFGNVIKHIELIVKRNLVHFAMIRRQRVKEKIFRRGYNDKGSRRPDHVVPIVMKPIVSSVPEKTDLSNIIKKRNHLLNFLYS